MIVGDLDLTAWLEGTYDREWPPGDGQELVVGDFEVVHIVDTVAGVYRLAKRDRGGTPQGIASCSDFDTAARLLVIVVGRYQRSSRRLPRVVAETPDPAAVEETPVGVHVSWDGGWAELVDTRWDPDLPGLLVAAATRPLSVVAASLRDPQGAPLFSVPA